MLYDLSIETDKSRAERRFSQLKKEGSIIELTKKQPRTLSQNSYLHLLLGWFAIEYGETLEYVKQRMFKPLSKDIFEYERVNPKSGELRKAYRSSRDVSAAQMTTAIDRFRGWSSKEAAIYLPEPNEDKFLASIQVEMERQKQYL